MTQAQLEKYLDVLWEKHGHPDRHGYKDDMHPAGFHDAAREMLQDFGVDLKAAKLDPAKLRLPK